MDVDRQVLLAILGMGAVTYLTRVSGYWLIGRITPAPWLLRWLDYLPGTVLIAVATPAVIASGWRGIVAASVTLLIAARRGSVLLAMVAGVLTIFVLRLI